ncbi:hypothetical protein N7519_011025 [Penicillium mononematosum]|uniref:uncharacterized protein n=1 Tax=Penicillium mononematosum TaxID=268346 RepID=UPI002549193F|nr:uncharacterized protein N7519_011025 [Penicillium mononematosum]KAJ6180564.1 hypothetical protein N7519_011025 [Penicillium mononematosum]
MGDVSISVPTDGSWSQYDNPHRPVKEISAYGPGYVPGCSPQDPTPRPLNEEDPEDDARSVCSAASTSSRRSSLSLGSLRPGRLSVRLASRPKQLRGETQIERDAHRSEQKRNEFAYRPIQQDYTSEVIEKTTQPSNRFRYIPTNGRLRAAILSTRPAAPTRGAAPCPSLSDRRYSGGRDRDQYTPAIRGSTYYEEDRHSLHSSSFRDSSDSSSSRWNYGLPPRRRTSPFVPADSKRASSISKPMTLAMVPDPDDLYE